MTDPNTKTFEAANKEVRYVIQQGGTRSGKTFSIVYYLLLYALRNPGASISIVSESLPHLKRGAIRDLRTIIADRNMDFTFTENKTDHIFTTSKGSFIECFGADTDTKLRGAKRDILFINECNNISYDAFEELDVRTRIKTILDFNPVRHFWVHDKLLPLLKPEDYVFVISTYKDNQYLSAAEIANIERRQSRKTWWKIFGQGEVGLYEGNVFTNWDIWTPPPGWGNPITAMPNPFEGQLFLTNERRPLPAFNKQRQETHPLPGKLIGYGIDFGFTHCPTAVVQMNEYEDEYYVRQLFYRTGTTTGELFEELKNKVNMYDRAVADSAEPRTIRELYLQGWRGIRGAIKGKGSLNFGINKLQERKIHISMDSADLISEFKNYLWDKNIFGLAVNKPVKGNDHAIDAMRYLISYPKLPGLCVA